jgi:beta-glucosidase
MPFPKDFLWGAATASYQIEGGGLSEGRGECIWHRFSHTPGKTKNGDTGDVACDHLHRYADDVALMQSLGLQAYRFSTSWARVLPQGVGTPNERGLDFYDRLVDALLKAGIQPFATLYHWDFPQALQDRGGWASQDSPAWFAEYADLMTRRLGDRVRGWITFNEPWCISLLSNLLGVHAPGNQDMNLAYKVAHGLNLAHGAAMGVIRQNCPQTPAGIVLNLYPAMPASDSDQDKQAAHIYDGWFNRWFLDPVYKGEYPADMVELLSPALEGIDLSAVSAAAAPTDFLGVNFYTRGLVRWDDSQPLKFTFARNPDPNTVYTAMDWEVYPQGLTDILVRVHQDYQPKAIYVTENGAAFDDPDSVPASGSVDDPQRTDYLRTHFAAAENAIAQGVPLKGYFVWSLMDNYEWAEGYTKRFGIVHVDYTTQQRTPKQSALWYQDFIKNHS